MSVFKCEETHSTDKDSGWDFFFWFAVSSPLLGLLVAIVALAIVQANER